MNKLKIANSEGGFCPVDSFLEFTFKGNIFFVHRSVGCESFTISEKSTGFGLTKTSKVDEALDEMYRFMNEFFENEDAFKKRIDKRIAEYLKSHGQAN